MYHISKTITWVILILQLFPFIQASPSLLQHGRSLVQRIGTGITKRREALEVIRSKQRFYNQTAETTSSSFSSSLEESDHGRGRRFLNFKRRRISFSHSSNKAAAVVVSKQEEKEKEKEQRTTWKEQLNRKENQEEDAEQRTILKRFFFWNVSTRENREDDKNTTNIDKSIMQLSDEKEGEISKPEEEAVSSSKAFFKYLFNMNVHEDWNSREKDKDKESEDVDHEDSIPLDTDRTMTQPVEDALVQSNEGVTRTESKEDETSVEVQDKRRGDTFIVSLFGNIFQKKDETMKTEDRSSSDDHHQSPDELSTVEPIQNMEQDDEDNDIDDENTSECQRENNLAFPEAVINRIKDCNQTNRGDVSVDSDTLVHTKEEEETASYAKNDESLKSPMMMDASENLQSHIEMEMLGDETSKTGKVELEENEMFHVEMYSNKTEESDIDENDEDSEIDLFMIQNDGEDNDEEESNIDKTKASIQKNETKDTQSVQDNIESKTPQTDDYEKKEKKTVFFQKIYAKKNRTSKVQKHSKRGNRSAFTRSLHNALPWLDKQNQTDDTDQKLNQVEGTASTTTVQQNTTSTTAVQSQPSFPPSQGGPSSSSLIFLSSSPMMRGNVGYPRGMPPPNTESSITGLFQIFLPLLSRLFLLTILSSSALFGFGESHVYSPEPSQHFMLERLHNRYDKDSMALKKALEGPPDKVSKYSWAMEQNKRKAQLKKVLQASKNGEKEIVRKKAVDRFSRTVIVMNVQTLDRDMDDVISELRDSVSFVLSQYHDENIRLNMGKELEVVVCVESPGGVVQDFGLAADQLARLKDAGVNKDDIILTVCVDKIAASGGYMMACQASPGKLLAAPFAVLGSIGVLRETINIHDVLEKYGVQPLVLKAGDAKVPLTQTTKVTEESIAIVQKNLERAHDAFRELVSKTRGQVIAEHFHNVTNGDIFLGKDAARNGLVDQLMTSDEYITQKIEAGDRVLKLHKYDRSRMGLRLSPLDLLLLKSNGLLGKSFTNQLHQLNKMASKLKNMAMAFGFMKAFDTALCFLSSNRQFRKNHI